jgi:hypothetical protein
VEGVKSQTAAVGVADSAVPWLAAVIADLQNSFAVGAAVVVAVPWFAVVDVVAVVPDLWPAAAAPVVAPLGLLLFLRLCLLLLLRGLSLFFLFLVPRLNRGGNSEQQKKCSRANDFNRLHVLSP